MAHNWGVNLHTWLEQLNDGYMIKVIHRTSVMLSWKQSSASRKFYFWMLILLLQFFSWSRHFWVFGAVHYIATLTRPSPGEKQLRSHRPPHMGHHLLWNFFHREAVYSAYVLAASYPRGKRVEWSIWKSPFPLLYLQGPDTAFSEAVCQELNRNSNH